MKKIFLFSVALLSASYAFSQSAIDAYRLSQPDMKGTARFMSMGGAFTALGGDLSTLSQNPGGIGVYRNSDIGFTLDLDMQHSTGESGEFHSAVDQTKFLLNNIGFVWTLRLPSQSCPNINVGFTYNKSASFNRRYSGAIGLTNGTQSLSNLVANVATLNGYSVDMLAGDNDPYNPSGGNYGADWLSILAYNSYLISPTGKNSYEGQWRDNVTTGYGYFDVMEKGSVDSYNIALGGNISNVVFWGMDFDITHMNYTLTPNWTEVLNDAFVGDDYGNIDRIPAAWTLDNFYNCSGTGFNYKLGFIVKPIQEFRLGFAFHTPTWYTFNESFSANLAYQYGDPNYPNNLDQGYASTDDGYMSYNDVNFRTPWKITAGAAAVLFNRLILSADYEWAQYSNMKYSAPTYNYGGPSYDPWDDPWYPWYAKPKMGAAKYIGSPYLDEYYDINENIKQIYQNTNTVRIGAELRLLPQLSLRAGYAHVSSPVRSEAKSAVTETAGTIPNYRFDNETNYVTCGLGFNVKGFYVDAAYIYKQMESEYHAYSPWNNYAYGDNSPYNFGTSPTSKLHLSNSQVVLSMGYKF